MERVIFDHLFTEDEINNLPKHSAEYEHWQRYKWVAGKFENKKVLDISCGTGYGSELLALNGNEVIGIDISAEAVEYAQKHFKKATFHVGNAEDLSVYSDNSIDGVVSFETIEHLNHPEKFISEVRRVLKRGGKFYGSVPRELDNPQFREHNIFHKNFYGFLPDVIQLLSQFMDIRVISQEHDILDHYSEPQTRYFVFEAIKRENPVSVVIPTYNSQDVFERCYQGFLKAGYPYILTAIDNSSKDKTYLKRPGVNVVYNDKNFKFTHAVNQGLELNKEDYVLLINPDCSGFLEQGWLSKMVKDLQDKKAGVAGAILKFPDGTIQHAGAYGHGSHTGYKEEDKGQFDMVSEVEWVTGACLPPSENIETEKGIKNINDIRIGNKVLSHDGKYHKVTQIFQRDYSDDLIKVKVQRFGTTKLTGEHPVFVINKESNLPIWVEAKNLKKNDVILYPINSEKKELINIKFSNVKSRFKKAKKMLDEIKIDKDLLTLLGYYISEGSIDRWRVEFTLNLKEENIALEIGRILKEKFNLNISKKKRLENHRLDVRCYSVNLIKFLSNLCGIGAVNKFIPEFLMGISPELQKYLIKSLWEGDGSIDNKYKTATYATISKKLIYQIKQLLIRQEIAPCFQIKREKEINRINHKRAYFLKISDYSGFKKITEIMKRKITMRVNHRKTFTLNNNYIYLPITSIEKIKYKGKVYNLEVKDTHTYISNSLCLHNCMLIKKEVIEKVGKWDEEKFPHYESDREWCRKVKEADYSIIRSTAKLSHLEGRSSSEPVKKHEGKLRILWHSNSAWTPTGYGVQTNNFTEALHKEGYPVAISSYYGLEGGILKMEGIPCYPKMMSTWGEDSIVHHSKDFQADVVITLMDIWPLQTSFKDQVRWIAITPVDHDEVPPPVLVRAREAWKVVAYSRHGQEAFKRKGIEATYIPHCVDTKVFKPLDKKESRKTFAIPEDCYLVGMVAQNKSSSPSRKSFQQALEAFRDFAKDKPEVRLYLHTIMDTSQTGMNIMEYCNFLGIGEKIIWTLPYNYLYKFGPEDLAKLYSSFDVLLNPATGEGFGVPIIESQACGTPVVVGDWTSMSELCGSGEKVDWSEKWFTPLAAYQFFPKVGSIVKALEKIYIGPKYDMKVKAVEFAKQYDVDKVVKDYFVPFLESI